MQPTTNSTVRITNHNSRHHSSHNSSIIVQSMQNFRRIALFYIPPIVVLALFYRGTTGKVSSSDGTNSSTRSRKESSSSCFERLQDADWQNVQWQLVNETAASEKDKKTTQYKSCSKMSWRHETGHPSCHVDQFDAQSFLSTFRRRSLVFAGDSIMGQSCLDLQGALTRAGYGSSRVKTSYTASTYRRQIKFGCEEFEYDVLICCSWLAFSNAKQERAIANQNLFSGANAIALNVLEPCDLFIWNTGIHHTSHFSGTLQDMQVLINKTLADWQESKTKASVPTIWWKESYAQHFKNGHWDSWADVKRYTTKRYKKLKRQCYDITDYSVENETGIFNQAAEPLVNSFNIPILRVYKASVPLHQHHPNSKDCTHYCVEDRGPFDHENALLANLIQHAIDGNHLPPLPKTRRLEDSNQSNLQERWDLLMEHPSESLMSRLEVCANSDWGRPKYRHSYEPPYPPALQKCLEHSKQVHKKITENKKKKKNKGHG